MRDKAALDTLTKISSSTDSALPGLLAVVGLLAYMMFFGIFSLGMYFFTFRYLPETAGVSLEKIHGLVLKQFNIEVDESELMGTQAGDKPAESFNVPMGH